MSQRGNQSYQYNSNNVWLGRRAQQGIPRSNPISNSNGYDYLVPRIPRHTHQLVNTAHSSSQGRSHLSSGSTSLSSPSALAFSNDYSSYSWETDSVHTDGSWPPFIAPHATSTALPPASELPLGGSDVDFHGASTCATFGCGLPASSSGHCELCMSSGMPEPTGIQQDPGPFSLNAFLAPTSQEATGFVSNTLQPELRPDPVPETPLYSYGGERLGMLQQQFARQRYTDVGQPQYNDVVTRNSRHTNLPIQTDEYGQASPPAPWGLVEPQISLSQPHAQLRLAGAAEDVAEGQPAMSPTSGHRRLASAANAPPPDPTQAPVSFNRSYRRPRNFKHGSESYKARRARNNPPCDKCRQAHKPCPASHTQRPSSQ